MYALANEVLKEEMQINHKNSEILSGSWTLREDVLEVFFQKW